MVLADLDGKGDDGGRGTGTQDTRAREQSVGSGTPVIECGGNTKAD